MMLCCIHTAPVFNTPPSSPVPGPSVTAVSSLTAQVFRRWDGQATLIANNIMAKKAIRNQWRSSRYLHHTMIAVSVDTPMEKLDQMKNGIAAGLRVSVGVFFSSVTVV